jgi:hypothetical protein
MSWDHLSYVLARPERSWSYDMARPLWQLLLEDPSDLTCEECFAVMEYYAEVLAMGSTDLLRGVIEHLKECPDCRLQHREALRHLRRAGGIADMGEPRPEEKKHEASAYMRENARRIAEE